MEYKWISIILNIIFLLSITLIGINLLLNVDLIKFISLKGETNDYCQKFNNSINNLDYFACDNKFKKNKIILLLIDSLPFDKLHEITDFEKLRLPNFFKGQGLDYKQSGALFESIFTGKFSRNYLANSNTEYDTLAQQFKNANMDMFYKIRKFPIGQLIDNSIFTKLEFHDGELIPLLRFCENEMHFYNEYSNVIEGNFLDKSISDFKKGLNEELLYERAHKDLDNKLQKIHLKYNECFAKNDFYSYVFYTECLDHFIHVSHKNYPTNIYKIFYVEQVIKEVIKWINEEHEEYALAVVSDHGGQYYYGEDALCNHGCNTPGNEAVLFVYTKELGENYETYKIDNTPLINMNDYPCIIAQTLKNVNLPLETSCTPRIIGNDPIIKFSSIKSKEAQLKNYIEKLCNKYPELNKTFHEKYDKKLYNHKFIEYFKDIDSILNTEDKIFDEYIKYLTQVQDDIFNDVIRSGQNATYYILFYLAIIFFVLGLIYHFRNLILLIRNKVLKTLKKIEIKNDLDENEKNDENILLKKLVKYFIIIFIILISDSIICLLFNKSLNISNYINFSVFFKYISLLLIMIAITFWNNLQNRQNYRKIIYIIAFVIILNMIMSYIKIYSFIDKYTNTQSKSDFLKKYISYPSLFIYAILEFYLSRNYYIFKKFKIKYNYIIIPYLVISAYFLIKFDISVKQHMPPHDPSNVLFMRRIYLSIFLLLLFIKPLQLINNQIEISNVIFNTKLFLIVMIDFICIETERVIIILLYLYIMLYLCECFKKEKDIFLKLIYIIIISCYPQIFFIGNQGTYSMDSSIKITIKCPSQYADDLPVIMGIIFATHKFKYYILSSSYLFSLYKRTKNKSIDFFSEFVKLIFLIQLYAMVICYLYFLKKEIEHSYIQLLFLIATKAIPLFLYELNYLINLILYLLLNKICNIKNTMDYQKLEQIEQINKII